MPLKLLYVILTPPGPTQEFIELEDSEGNGVGDVPMERDPRSNDASNDFFRLGPFVALGDRLRVLQPRDPEQPPITEQEYIEAIRALLDGKSQLWPDGKSCAICTDSGHQAWECRFNPLVLARSFQLVEASASELHDQLHRLLGL